MSKEPYDPMGLKALLCVERMASHGSLTQASIELGISDAAVSQHIKSLEKYLGAKLYEARGGLWTAPPPACAGLRLVCVRPSCTSKL